MKKLPLIATIYIVLSLLFVIGNFTVVMAAPDRILEPSFETVAEWTYHETDADFTDGAQSQTWKTQGSNSYLLSATGGGIGPDKFTEIYQSVNFDLIDTIFFDCQLEADSTYLVAYVIVDTDYLVINPTPAWEQACPSTATEYLQQSVDVSGYTGTQYLIFRVENNKSGAPLTATMACYFDNIKIWGSHNDATWLTVENSFAGATDHAYMYGENFDDDLGTATKVGWYDGGGTLRETDTWTSWGGGTLNWSECQFTDFVGVAAAGDWHAVVILTTDALPAAYADALNHANFVADDVFNVAATAIPEFPEVMAAIGVAGLCFGIYWWMRKRVHGVCGVKP